MPPPCVRPARVAHRRVHPLGHLLLPRGRGPAVRRPAGEPGAPVYGLVLFPEAALALLGTAWSPYQGLRLQLFVF